MNPQLYFSWPNQVQDNKVWLYDIPVDNEVAIYGVFDMNPQIS